MKNLLTLNRTKIRNCLEDERLLSGERAIHLAMFALILVGLCGISAWAIYASPVNDLLKIAAMALSWGIILLILYVGFKKLEWNWWS
jgi:hypothetical protein